MPTHSVDRRTLLAMGTALSALGQASIANAADAPGSNPAPGARSPMALPPDAPKVSMLIHPKMVTLDLIGPLTLFKIARFDVQIVWKDKAPVTTTEGIALTATHTFEEAADAPAVLFVPGGIMGTIDCMGDAEVTNYLADRGNRAQWVTSVCTGSLLLGAAGLLQGYGATSHWAVSELLPILGAHHVDERVVFDRNRVTGGGVTAGLDFALALISKMQGEEAARRAQLVVEYAPAPPFRNGTPEEAGSERTASARKARQWMDSQARIAAEAAAARLRTS